jgi:NADPH:quinone reductase-like Zn-dependent oxidoreductase
MSTHSAIATVGLKAPLGLIQVPTVKPTGEQVRVRVEWTASTPLDLHQNDGGLLVKHPQVLGDGTAGTVVEVGPDVKRLKVGDKVFGFTWRSPAEKSHQEFCTTDEWLFALVRVGTRNVLFGSALTVASSQRDSPLPRL